MKSNKNSQPSKVFESRNGRIGSLHELANTRDGLSHKTKKSSIIFDLDSTLVTIEGLDYLADKLGVGEEVKLLTSAAMNGAMAMNAAMRIKLALIKPSRKDFIHLGNYYCKQLVSGAKKVINHLKTNGHEVYIITGNFTPSATIIAEYLGIKIDHVYANEVYFDKLGCYAGFDYQHPLANNGGKLEVIKKINGNLYKPIMIGDGVTDLETKPLVHKFIGFGGVVTRTSVQQTAGIYVTKPSLTAILQYV